jgi:hypothetical protein
MVLVEADAVETELVQLLPGIEVLGIGADRRGRVEMLLRQRVRQLPPGLEVVEVLAIGQQVEDEDFPARVTLLT